METDYLTLSFNMNSHRWAHCQISQQNTHGQVHASSRSSLEVEACICRPNRLDTMIQMMPSSHLGAVHCSRDGLQAWQDTVDGMVQQSTTIHHTYHSQTQRQFLS